MPAIQPWKRIDNRSVIVFCTICTKDRQAILANDDIHETNLAQWEKEGWDRQLRRGDPYRQKSGYVGSNPVRHGLAEEAANRSYKGEIRSLHRHD